MRWDVVGGKGLRGSHLKSVLYWWPNCQEIKNCLLKQEGVEISKNLEEIGSWVFNQNSVFMLYNYTLRAPHKSKIQTSFDVFPGLRWPPNDQVVTELNTLLGVQDVMNFAQGVAIKANKQKITEILNVTLIFWKTSNEFQLCRFGISKKLWRQLWGSIQ